MIPEATPVDLPPPLSPSPDAESLLRELAVVKIERAECADLLDRKLLELRKLNQKYEAVENELIATRETITRLQREKVHVARELTCMYMYMYMDSSCVTFISREDCFLCVFVDHNYATCMH